MTDHDQPDTDTSSTATPEGADFDAPWGLICPDCSLAIPFENPEETDVEAALEKWTCTDCGHSETPAVAPVDPGTSYDGTEVVRHMERTFFTHPCSQCGEPLVVYGVPSELAEESKMCEPCGTRTELSSENLIETTLGFQTISKDDLHLWRTEDRSGVEGGLHVLYGQKEETKARICDRHLRNQHGHGPLGSLQPGTEYVGLEYLGTLAEHAQKSHEDPPITRPDLPRISELLSNAARREVRADLAEFVTGCIKIDCGDCEETYAFFGMVGDVEEARCSECGSAEVILRDER